ncbi:M23 family metallopeptidase [Microbacterium paludicola]|uniref:M23 family metallopeptidase n=1 Tax=Microbacterium paludicola TaxID=300019 RepID=UPI003879D58D
MSVDDQSDVWRELRQMKKEIKRLQSSSMLENASITRGRFRVIGGQILVDSGGNLTIVGSFDLTGSADITGDVEISGPTSVTGPFDVTGTTSLSGDTTVDGHMNVTGGGKITVGSGDDVVILDSTFESPRINFGSAQIQSATGESFTFTMGTDVVYFINGTIRVPALSSPPSGTSTRYVVADALGNFYSAPAGGPVPGEGGDPGTPGEPGDNPAGYIYPVDLSRWNVTDDYADHVARGSQEPGVDWATSWGTPVWAPGDGTIVDVKPTNSDATGRYVTLVTDAGDWYRFLHLSSFPVSVGQTVNQGDVIAYSGGSGFGSDAGYALHLHVSFKRGYTGAGWPGASALDDLLAYMAEAA